MLKRFALATVFVMSGFLAGLVVTGRMKTADETLAKPAPPPAPAAAVEPRAPVVPAALPDLSGTAARAVGSVTNIASRQTVRMPNSPFASVPT